LLVRADYERFVTVVSSKLIDKDLNDPIPQVRVRTREDRIEPADHLLPIDLRSETFVKLSMFYRNVNYEWAGHCVVLRDEYRRSWPAWFCLEKSLKLWQLVEIAEFIL
jgi:hypothetical protein